VKRTSLSSKWAAILAATAGSLGFGLASAADSDAVAFVPFSQPPSKAENTVLTLMEKDDATIKLPRFSLLSDGYMLLDDGRFFVSSSTGSDCFSELTFVNPAKALVIQLGESGTVIEHSASKIAEWWIFDSSCENHWSGRILITAVVRFANMRDRPTFTQLVEVRYEDVIDSQTGEIGDSPSVKIQVCDLTGNGTLGVSAKITNKSDVTYRSFSFSKRGFTAQKTPHVCPRRKGDSVAANDFNGKRNAAWLNAGGYQNLRRNVPFTGVFAGMGPLHKPLGGESEFESSIRDVKK
jgi:hypothetical protein